MRSPEQIRKMEKERVIQNVKRTLTLEEKVVNIETKVKELEELFEHQLEHHMMLRTMENEIQKSRKEV